MKTILIAVLIFVLIVAVLLVVLTATVGRRHIKRVSEKAKQKTLYLQNLQTDVELLAEVDPPPMPKPLCRRWRRNCATATP